MKFPCTMCGLCCRTVEQAVAAAEYMGLDLGYEFPLNDDGSCANLIPIKGSDNTTHWGCKIYDSRPYICRVGFNKPENMSAMDYFRLTANICNSHQEAHNLDQSYRVIIYDEE